MGEAVDARDGAACVCIREIGCASSANSTNKLKGVYRAHRISSMGRSGGGVSNRGAGARWITPASRSAREPVPASLRKKNSPTTDETICERPMRKRRRLRNSGIEE